VQLGHAHDQGEGGDGQPSRLNRASAMAKGCHARGQRGERKRGRREERGGELDGVSFPGFGVGDWGRMWTRYGEDARCARRARAGGGGWETARWAGARSGARVQGARAGGWATHWLDAGLGRALAAGVGQGEGRHGLARQVGRGGARRRLRSLATRGAGPSGRDGPGRGQLGGAVGLLYLYICFPFLSYFLYLLFI
jgi:hypothetical protein